MSWGRRRELGAPPVLTSETFFCFDSVTLSAVLRTRAALSLYRSFAAFTTNLKQVSCDESTEKFTYSVPNVYIEFVAIDAEVHFRLK